MAPGEYRANLRPKGGVMTKHQRVIMKKIEKGLPGSKVQFVSQNRHCRLRITMGAAECVILCSTSPPKDRCTDNIVTTVRKALARSGSVQGR